MSWFSSFTFGVRRRHSLDHAPDDLADEERQQHRQGELLEYPGRVHRRRHARLNQWDKGVLFVMIFAARVAIQSTKSVPQFMPEFTPSSGSNWGMN